MCVNPPGPVTRAAVVIGVDRTGGLQPLTAAASGALEVGDWLCGEGYHVTRLTDANQATVTLAAVSAAVKAYVDKGTVEKLVIYFAGHGYLNGFAEIWLLSKAPVDPTEAIDQQESMEFARTSGIPSIVFISDTCRSTPQSLRADRVRGATIFPNLQPNQIDPEIDRFYATRPGDPAVELALDAARTQYAGLFTKVLKSAFIEPDPQDVRQVMVDGQSEAVITNRRLKENLPNRFVTEARAYSSLITQKPQLRLECGDLTFVARARTPPPPAALQPPVSGSRVVFRGAWAEALDPVIPTKSLEQTAREMVATGALAGPAIIFRGGLQPPEPVPSKTAAEFLGEIAQQRAADQTDHFETETGLRVMGAGVVTADGIGVGATILDQWSDEMLVRVHAVDDPFASPSGPGSVLVQFTGGTGTLVATIPGYITAITVRDGDVVNMSYVPSNNSARWQTYQARRDDIETMRATAAAAAKRAVLAVDRQDAMSFGARVRTYSPIDPTLGLYASLAYAGVGLRREIVALLDALRADLQADLFDVRLLAGADAADVPLVPPCPMLTQSWSYLSARRVTLPDFLDKAERRVALWTTFAAQAMPALRDRIVSGDFS